jgi:hypothetical protein
MMFAMMFGACLPGVLFYTVIQTRIRKKPTSAVGFVVVILLSLFIALPGIRRDAHARQQAQNVSEAQQALLMGIQRACETTPIGAERCPQLKSCTLAKLREHHPNDADWLVFLLGAVTDPTSKVQLRETVSACASELPQVSSSRQPLH